MKPTAGDCFQSKINVSLSFPVSPTCPIGGSSALSGAVIAAIAAVVVVVTLMVLVVVVVVAVVRRKTKINEHGG